MAILKINEFIVSSSKSREDATSIAVKSAGETALVKNYKISEFR